LAGAQRGTKTTSKSKVMKKDTKKRPSATTTTTRAPPKKLKKKKATPISAALLYGNIFYMNVLSCHEIEMRICLVLQA